MKKIAILLAILILLVSLIPSVLATGSASLTGPSTVRAGDTISVTFYAGGNIIGVEGSLSYDSSLLTLQSCTQIVGGSWKYEFSGSRFVCYDDTLTSSINSSTAIFKATFTVNSALTPGTSIQVSTNDVILTHSDFTETYAGSQTYSVQLAEPLSSNCALGALTVSNATLSPAFSPDVTRYSVSVPYSVSSLQLSATAADTKAKVSVDNPTLSAGATTTVTVTVTAEDGTVRKYTISTARAQDPNYVKSSNAALKALSVEGFLLSPAFSEDVLQYYVWLPYEVDAVQLSATAADGKASVSVQNADSLAAGVGTKLTVTVTAEDGTKQVYTVTAVRAPAHEDTEAYLGGVREPDVTEPVTEPAVTEPSTEPVETLAPSTEPPVTVVQQVGVPPVVLVIACVICAAAGVAVCLLVNRRYY